MKHVILGAVAMLSLVACGDDGARRPVEIARTDSALVPVEDTMPEEVTAQEEPTVQPAPRPTRATSRATRPSKPKPSPEPKVDAREPDTANQASSIEDTVAIPADTAPSTPDTTSADATTPALADTATPGDTSGSEVRPRDTTVPEVRPPDTIGTSRPLPPRTPRPVVPSPAPGSPAAVTIPAGTELHAALNDSIHSRRDSVGRQVTAKVMENVRGPDGRTLVAAGATVRLTVVRIAPAGSRSADDGTLELRADGITQGDQLLAMRAEVRPVPHELRGRGVTGSEAAKVGAGAAAGAIAGRVLGGNTKGAVIGGVVGAAGGAAVAAQTADRDVVVKAGTPITLVLTAPLVAGRL